MDNEKNFENYLDELDEDLDKKIPSFDANLFSFLREIDFLCEMYIENLVNLCFDDISATIALKLLLRYSCE